MATFVAMATGVVIVFLMAIPTSLIVFLMPSILLLALWIAFQFTAPVTLGVLPVVAALLKGRPTASLFLLPVAGFAAGGISIWIWAQLTLTQPAGLGFEIFLALGMLAGLAAGAFLGRALYELRK